MPNLEPEPMRLTELPPEPETEDIELNYGRDILLVDDNHTNLIAIEAALVPLGRKLVMARSGMEALGRLSGGNRQRVNIAVGLLADPAVALLDEPSASLDPRQRERLWRFIVARAQAGMSIVFATHDIAEAERYADRVLVLADAEVLYGGSIAGLRGDLGGDLESAFVEFLRERGH